MALAFADGSDYLSAGAHAATAAEIKAFCVDAFPTSSRRSVLFERWEVLLEAIERVIKVETQWIDGSYVTKKEEPGDIDLVSHLDGETLDGLGPVERTLLLGLVAGQLSKVLHGCDSFFLPVYPPEHPARAAYEAALDYWSEWFGTDRAGEPKGYVELER
jgi:hypothetical protein